MEIINDYKLLTPLQNKNAGFSRWAYAAKYGEEFFIKEFMNPIYPDEDTLSSTLRESRIRSCKNFEEKKAYLYKTIDDVSDGNLVRVYEFFRCDSHYYISMPKITGEEMSFEDIARLPMEDRVLLCRTAARSVLAMHSAGIVHADIKNTNVLIQKTKTGKLAAKVIDYDSSFFEYDPPMNENELGGDQIYLSPEACLFFCGEETKLTCKMDVFSLGLLFHQYLTGELPFFQQDENHHYAHEAVLDGVKLYVSDKLNPVLKDMIEKMLLVNPDERIDIVQVFNILGTFMFKEDSIPYTFKDESGTNTKNTAADCAGGKTPQSFFHQAGNL